MTDKSREYYRKRNATMVAEYETEGLSIPEIAEKHGLKIQMAYLIVSKSKASRRWESRGQASGRNGKRYIGSTNMDTERTR